MKSDRCPVCGLQGRKVKAITPASLLTEAAKLRLDGSDGYRYCKSGSCKVVYFRDSDGTRFTTDDLKVPVFQKSTHDSRTVCYCFDHTVASIREEIRLTGTSKIPDTITEKCRKGLDRCVELNPQGACCLGNVKQVVKEAGDRTESLSPRHVESVPECCSPKMTAPQER